MTSALQVTFRSLDESEAINSAIKHQFDKLGKIGKEIQRCHVVVNFSKKHKHLDKLYIVHITLDVPGSNILVSKKTNQDLYKAIRGAFLAMEKLLVKQHKKRFARLHRAEQAATVAV